MTINVLFWVVVVGASLIWLGVGYFILFVKVDRKSSASVALASAPREDSEVIVSNTKIMINVLFSEDEKREATPAVLADFVISFKDIVSGAYKVRGVEAVAADPLAVQASTVFGFDPAVKREDESEADAESEPYDVPDLSDEPEMPELHPDENYKFDSDSELKFVDSSTLMLNMLNP